MRNINYRAPYAVAVTTMNTACEEHNLHFNLLHFHWPKEPVTHYFSLTDTDGAKKLYKNAFPKELSKVFSPEELTADFIYTSFGYNREGFEPVMIDLKTATLDYARLVFRDKLKYYFKKKAGKIVETGFIDNVIVWEFKDDQPKNAPYWLFEKYSVRAILASEKQNMPCLLISYEGTSKVLKQNITSALSVVSPLLIKKVKYKNSIISHKCFLEIEDADPYECFPTVNADLRSPFHIAPDTIVPDNKYKRYYEKIAAFYNSAINTREFRNFFPLTNEGFLKIPEASISRVEAECNRLYYEDGKNDVTMPKYNFKKLKPAERVKELVHVFFVYHADDKATMQLWKSYIKNGKNHYYQGLGSYASISCFVDDAADMVFHNKENPLPELLAQFEAYDYTNPSVKFLAMYVTPFTREETRQQPVRVMPLVREFFVRRNIAVQSAETGTINSAEFHWSLTTMSATIVAKLGGIPWRLKQDAKQELVIGVGAFECPTDNTKYLGASICFDNSGRFKTTDWFEKANIGDMAGYIATIVRRYADTYGNPDRLIIHFYKKLKENDILAIEKALQELELPKPIPVYIVSINKTEETEYVAFDFDRPDLLMPETGISVTMYNDQFLLFNNSRVGNAHSPTDHFHFPLKLHIQGNKLATLDTETKQHLIAQVYQYSKLNYRTLSQQNMPITLLALELMADFIPHFNDKTMPEDAKHLPWWL